MQLTERQRPGVEPARDAGEVRSRAEVGEARALPPAAAGQVPLGRAALLDPVGDAPGADVRERSVDVERDQEGRDRDHDAERRADAARVGAERGGAVRGPAAAVGDAEHRQRDAECVRERDEDPVARSERRRARGDRREHEPAARYEDEPECEPEQEAASEVAGRPARQTGERPFEHDPEPGHDQRRREDEEERDRDVSEQILR